MRFTYWHKRGVLVTYAAVFLVVFVSQQTFAVESSVQRPNVLFITADDMNWNTPGCYGGTAPDITPNIDRLAAEGMRFMRAHVTVAVCTPSRSVWLTGRYPHRSGVEGFQRIRQDVSTLPAVLREGGYLCATIGKPLGQQEIFKWSMQHQYRSRGGEAASGRKPKVMYAFAKQVFERSAAEGKPFFLMANSHDPHRPFHGSDEAKRRFSYSGMEVADPSRLYRPDEIQVPGFLPDLPETREEIAQYHSSVRRCDDTVGILLQAIDEVGLRDNTIVVFISDNGMSFPLAKTNCYLNSTRTPWIMRWPGKVRPGSVDDRHFVSGIDFMPTILEIAGVIAVGGMDGVSIMPLLQGQSQAARDKVFTQFYHITPEKWMTDEAVLFMRDQVKNRPDKPFFLHLSYFPPHHPYGPIEKYARMYDPEKLELPENFDRNKLKAWCGGQGRPTNMSDDDIRRLRAMYFAFVTQLDAQIGRLLDGLDELGLTDNTIVMFMSDHGDMLGEHGMFYKGVMYEGSARVPFILRWPGQHKTHKEQTPISHVDIMPTVLTAAGITPPAHLPGTDLKPLITGQTTWPDRAVYSEYYGPLPYKYLMVRKGAYKLIADKSKGKRHQTTYELYNIDTDPLEMINLVNKTENTLVLNEMKGLLDTYWEKQSTFLPETMPQVTPRSRYKITWPVNPWKAVTPVGQQ